MSTIYDNWMRLVSAVTKKQQLWDLFHEQSRSPSILSQASDSSSSRSQKPPPELVLISDFWPAFDVKDHVAMASIELTLLGRGTFGTAYVVTMDAGLRFVAKRLINSVAISELDFKWNMEIVGGVVHENVVALRAYYSSPDGEKLMLYDYYRNGSMYSLLFGENRGDVEWETRLKIGIGAARGMAEIHKQLGGKLVHGNIKASNIYLNLQWYGCVADFGLTNMKKPTYRMSEKWNAPEVKDTQNLSHASDVYSFGILLLELLTRKSATDIAGGPAAVDLVKLVNSVKSKERAAKVFDPDLLKHPSISKQMIKMLQIGMRCVARSAKKRPKIFEVMMMLEDIITLNQVSRSLNSAMKGVEALAFLKDTDCIYEGASAEILEEGSFGTSYKTTLANGNTVHVVKRLSDSTATFKEFRQHIEVFGRMNHINVGRLKAYYYTRDEKLLVYDYYNQGSLSASLHGARGVRKTFLDWGTRVKVALGAARGIAHIHGQQGRKLVLGNIKSTNIFLNGENHIIAFDAGLAKLVNPEGQSALALTPGYCAPEVAKSGIVSQATDVYNFGVVLLELVSGRASQHRANGYDTTVAEWIRSVDRGEWSGRVLDVKCLRSGNHEQAMMQLLHIARRCVSIVPRHRPSMLEVVKVLEEISGVEPETILEESSIQSGLEYLLEDIFPLLSP